MFISRIRSKMVVFFLNFILFFATLVAFIFWDIKQQSVFIHQDVYIVIVSCITLTYLCLTSFFQYIFHKDIQDQLYTALKMFGLNLLFPCLPALIAFSFLYIIDKFPSNTRHPEDFSGVGTFILSFFILIGCALTSIGNAVFIAVSGLVIGMLKKIQQK